MAGCSLKRQNNDNETPAFCQSLKEVVPTIPHVDKTAILGDFNARIWKDQDTRNAQGRHGVAGIAMAMVCCYCKCALT